MRSSTPCSAWAHGEITTSSVHVVSSLQNFEMLAWSKASSFHPTSSSFNFHKVPQGGTGCRDSEPNS